MSLYMGRNETSHAVTEALELLRKYPFQWITYNPNDPLANSVVTYLKMKGKVTTNRFHQFQAVPKHRTNPAKPKAKRTTDFRALRYARLRGVADAADAAFMRAVKIQFPKKRAGDARYHSNRFNAATKKAAERSRKATDALLALVRGK